MHIVKSPLRRNVASAKLLGIAPVHASVLIGRCTGRTASEASSLAAGRVYNGASRKGRDAQKKVARGCPVMLRRMAPRASLSL